MMSRFGAILLLLFAMELSAQNTSVQQEISDIRILYAKINREIASNTKICKRYVTTPEGYEAQKWRSVDSDADFNKKYYARSSACFLQKQSLAKVTIEVFSEAGDWADFREHFYYANGKLAFLFERQSTTQAYDKVNNIEIPGAPYILERRLYFDRNGNQLRKLEKAFASKGQQEFPAEFLYPLDFEVYMSVDQLPFEAKKKSGK